MQLIATLIGCEVFLVLALSWRWRRDRRGVVLPAVVTAVGTIAFVGGVVSIGSTHRDAAALVANIGLFCGLVPGAPMLCLAFLARAEHRPRLYWVAALAGVVFVACLFFLLAGWSMPGGSLIG